MNRIKLVVEYDGTNYCGWQIQNGQPSVQAELEKALFKIFHKNIRITAAGRTDSGVHARNQVVHLEVPACDLFRLKGSLNGLTDGDIVIKAAEQCGPDFHARFDATARRYRYAIARQPTALSRNFAWVIYHPLNITLMQQGALLISRYKDFRAFCKVNSEVKHYLCDIHHCRWLVTDDLLIFEIQANRFLHGMVRAVTGTLVELGRGKITLELMKQIIESRDRTKVPATAPAQGLVLENVFY